MKVFFIKITVFIIALISVYGLFVHKLSEDFVDIYYEKFTSQAGGLILGISKASKGIDPAIIENELKSFEYDKPLINFALNVKHSQYGDMYFEAIKKKLKNKVKKQLFILSVSPGSFATPASMNENDIVKLDKKTIIGKTDDVSSKSNYNYIVNNYSEPLYNALHEYEKWPYYNLHENGWLEIESFSGNDSITSKDIAFAKSNMIHYFDQSIKGQEPSEYRINTFIKLFEFLKTRGDVFLIRIPEDKEFMDIENNFWPDFDIKMDSIANKHNLPFFNYSNFQDKFKTYDGLHFESRAAKQFTKMLSEDIHNYLKTKKHPNFL